MTDEIQIRLFKLVTGEEIIAQADESEQGWFVAFPVIADYGEHQYTFPSWIYGKKNKRDIFLPRTAVILFLIEDQILDALLANYKRYLDLQNMGV